MKNIYIEYRSWIFFWGLNLDSQKAVQKYLDKYNKEGWKLKELNFASPTQMGIFKMVLILFISTFTLGFINYWVGFYMIFEKNEAQDTKPDLDKTTLLKNLKDLLDKGSISQAEFEKEKQNILNS
ncbi:MAG: SHOCT domain-containing protein [Thermonemataceae bacterium]|nr:SHOCT domain-containing protein [Thermonemataceae bacterium]